MTGTLALAASIAAMDREALEHLVAHRRIGSPDTVDEPLSLALELLKTDSLTRALQGAHRDELRLLRALEGEQVSLDRRRELGALDHVISLGLVGLDAASGLTLALPEVTAVLDDLAPSLGDPAPSLGDPAPAVSDPSSAGGAVTGARGAVVGVLGAAGAIGATTDTPRTADHAVDTSKWYGQALTSLRQVAHLIRVIAKRPVKLGRKGSPTVIALRELADTTHTDADVVSRLIEVMARAGLLAPSTGHSGGQELVPTGPAREWLQFDYPTRWLSLAEAGIARFDARLRREIAFAASASRDQTSILDQSATSDPSTLIDLRARIDDLPREYPLLPAADLDQARRSANIAEDLGLTVHGHLTPSALALLGGDREAAQRIAEEQIPPPVAGVYLQPDLSVIVPGPLPPEDEAALSAVTETEQLGPAASLRLAPSALERAVRTGISPGAIRALLERLSLTGIPQPLDYLLRDLDRRWGESDQAAAATGDTTEPETAASGHGTAAIRSKDQPDRDRPDQPSGTRADRESRLDPGPGRAQLPAELAEMVERVLSADRSTGTEGDLTRRLKLAIRERSTVRVVAVAGDDEREFTLLPVSLQGGRLRATDQVAGVERTLPVSAITTVESA